MIRNQYNQIRHPAPDTKQERNTNNEVGIKNKTAQAENQEVSSFPADGHWTILNKANKKSKKQNADNDI